MEEIRKKALEIYNTRKKKFLHMEFQENKTKLSKEEQDMRIKEIVKKILNLFDISNQKDQQMISSVFIKSEVCAVVFEESRRLCLCDNIYDSKKLVAEMEELNKMRILEDEYLKICKIFRNIPNYTVDFQSGNSYLIIEMNRPTICKN